MDSEADRPAGLEEISPLLPRRPISVSSSVTSSTSFASSTRQYHRTVRAVSFVIAVLSALCGNSFSVFSLYAPLLQQRLHYNQFQVNGLSMAASVSLYLPVPILGYICDRFGPRALCAIATVCFGFGYGAAAAVYQYVDLANRGLAHAGDDVSGTYPIMVAAFISIGTATCGMYLAPVAVTAKNFGKGKHRGLALSIPITCFGLSGMWISQIGSRVFYEHNPDGTRGDVDVYRFFCFLATLLVAVGILGMFLLRVVNEEEMIEEAVEELTSSGILDGSALLGRRDSIYGSTSHSGIMDEEAVVEESIKDTSDEDDAKWKKNFLLNAETRRFICDHTMWSLTLGFFLVIGPGEAFINNMGTIIGTLYNPSAIKLLTPTSPATHVSIVAFASTSARILSGTLSDMMAPNPTTDHPQISGAASPRRAANYRISRISFLVFFAMAMSIGFLTLASGLVQEHGGRFWVVSSLVGLGYGGVFSLTPIVVTVIWGVENFATNFGIVTMFPAFGSIVWSLIYSAGYDRGARDSSKPHTPNTSDGDTDELFCYGAQCYATAFWGMTISVWIGSILIFWAWKGRNGWAQRRVIV